MNKWIVLLLIGLFIAPVFALSEYIVDSYPGPDGRLINKIVVPGIPEGQRVPGPLAEFTRNTVLLSGVPTFDWSYGCSATSAAMMAGYYDRGVFGHVYYGPTNAGVMPLNNSSWGVGECPLSATHQGYDGLSTAGHVDRFWTDNSGNDPFGPGDPTGTYNGCTADYMGTNQQWWGNGDGATTFYFYVDGSALYDPQDGTTGPPFGRDGIHGLRLFFESRGYSVSVNYNQFIYGWDGNSIGYTYDQYKASIDAGIPVMIQIQGHSMVGIGYESTSNTIYVLNTWDFGVHTMTWGGVYSGMAHYGVGIVQLNPPPSMTVDGDALNGNLPVGEEGFDSINISNWGPGPLTYILELGALRALSSTSVSTPEVDRNITGSTLVLDTLFYSQGATVDWNFTVHNASTDDEWLKYIYITFPPGVTINSVSNFIGGGGGDMYPDTNTGEDITIGWYNDPEGWGMIYMNQSAVATINVTIASSFAGILSLPYQIIGDIYGSEPHTLTGSIDLNVRPPLLPWFDVQPLSGIIPAGTSQNITGLFYAIGMVPGTYEAVLNLNTNDPYNPLLNIPVTLIVTGNLTAQISVLYPVTGGIHLEWDELPSVAGYKVYRSEDPYGEFSLIGTTSNPLFEDTTPLNKAFYLVLGEY